MKSFLRKTTYLLLLLSASSITAMANTDSLYFTALGIQPSKFILEYASESNQASKAEFKILDEDNNLLIKNLFQGEIKKVYNFENLPIGDYTIVLENEVQKIIQPIRRVYKSTEIKKDEQLNIVYPTIEKLSGNKISVDRTNSNFKNPLQIIFTDNDQDYEEAYNLKKNKSYVFDLDNLPQGSYEVKLVTRDKVISRMINI